VTVRREVMAALGLAVVGGVLLLVAEPVLGLVALAGTGAAALLQPAARLAMAAVLLLVALGAVMLALARSDALLGAGGALVVAGAVVATLRSRRWPPPRSAPAAAPDREPRARDTWDALDRGEDPTL
jgi:hypothetical protein